MGSRTKKHLITAAKFIITGLALYFVFRKINWDQVSDLLLQANPFLLILATVFFILSKVISAFRLQLFFRNIDLYISDKYNLKLAWLGMFYNLFLPGGVGGDGYKVYLLNKQHGTKVKLLIQAALIDRISGLVSLLILVGVGFLLLDLSVFPKWVKYTDFICLALVFPVFYFCSRLLFKPFVEVVSKSLIWSLGVQLMQVVSAILILAALGITYDQIAYSVLFLISSFVSILPFTIGGLGSREITFLLGFQYFGIDESYSIALSLLFTLTTVVVSFGGVFVKTTQKN